MHIAETEIAAAKTVGDFLVIQPEQMLHGCHMSWTVQTSCTA